MTDTLSERDIFESAGPGALEGSQQPEPSPRDTVPAVQERPTPNLGQLPDDEGEGGQGERQPQQPEGQQAAPQDPPRRTMLDDLKDERKRRQEIERQAAAKDREFAEMQGAFRNLQTMFQQMQGQARQQPSQAPQRPQEAPDPYVDPEGFNRFHAQQVYQQQFQPIQQHISQRDQTYSRKLANLDRTTARLEYGKEVVAAAEEAFNTAAARRSIHPLEHERINNSDNPFAAAVEWYQREQALATVGSDPNKWMESEVQRRLREDPAFQQQVMASLQGQAQQAAGTSVPAAGRPAPVFTGLPSLNATAGTSGQQASGPMSEADIFNAAPPKMGQRR